MSKPISQPKQETALQIYYTRIELSNTDIRSLFGGNISNTTITRLKNIAKEEMVKENIYTWQPQNVNTHIAFKAWGLNIKQMEQNFNKLKELGFIDK